MTRFLRNFTGFILLVLLLSGGCSLDNNDGTDQLSAFLKALLADPENVGKSFTTPMYQNLEMFFPTSNIWALQEHPGDHAYSPDRGIEWDDNGIWRVLHTHEWNSDHVFIENAWNSAIGGIAMGINAQNTMARAGVAPQLDPLKAEVGALRGLFIITALDIFGQVVLIDGLDAVVLSRSEAVNLAIQELEDALDLLPEKPELNGVESISRITKSAARALLARLYLNKHIYEGSSNPTTPDLLKIVENCNAIIQTGNYGLDQDYWNIFSVENNSNTGSSDEVILSVLSNEARNISPQLLTQLALHSSHFETTNFLGFNAFAVLPDFYTQWDTTDSRFKGPVIPGFGLHFGFLEGLQYDDDGMPLFDFDGVTQLDYSLDCPIIGATSSCGVRAVKYEPEGSGTFPTESHFAIIRLAEVYLMKTEAEFRLGSQAEAINTINTLRASRSNPPISVVTDQNLLDEYGFELWWEGQRRMHQIRFGTFLDPVSYRDDASDPTRTLFPIPQIALDQIPDLEQNPGY